LIWLDQSAEENNSNKHSSNKVISSVQRKERTDWNRKSQKILTKNDKQEEQETWEYGYPAPYWGWESRTQHRLDNTGFLSSFGNQISVSKDKDLWFWGKWLEADLSLINTEGQRLLEKEDHWSAQHPQVHFTQWAGCWYIQATLRISAEHQLFARSGPTWK
jgi:hypothetical protein